MIIVLLIVFGLCFGSFVNALVWRIYQQAEGARRSEIGDRKSKTNSKLQTPNYSILKGRSMCPHCKHELAAKDLVPVLSWLTLKGKCRYCKKPISWQYPVVELTTAALFVLSYCFWPYLPLTTFYLLLAFAAWLVVLVGLIALAVYDIKWMLLPDKILKPLFVFAVVSVLIQIILGRPYKDLWQVAFATVIGGGIFWILYQVSKGKWIGGGDVKLGFLLGFVLAKPSFALLYIFVASVLGMIYSAPMLISKKIKATSKVPFGPFLIAGAIITMLFGQQLIDWYLSSLSLK